MWNGCKDIFSVLCQCFCKCILIAEEEFSLGVLDSLHTLKDGVLQWAFLHQLSSSS